MRRSAWLARRRRPERTHSKVWLLQRKAKEVVGELVALLGRDQHVDVSLQALEDGGHCWKGSIKRGRYGVDVKYRRGSVRFVKTFSEVVILIVC